MAAIVAWKWLEWTFFALSLFSTVASITSSKSANMKPNTPSRTYSDTMATMISNTACIPIIYGTVKSAGNLIYSRLSNDKKHIYKLISFCDGEIEDIYDIKLDDKPIGSGEFEGVSWNVYKGNGEQQIDSRVVGETQIAKASAVGGLKYDAYLAMQASANDALSGNFNVTALIKGRKVRVYSDLNHYTEIYSDNPAWCVLDFLTCYNGVGLDHSELDMQSFLDAAKFYSEKNYTLNLILDEQRPRIDWVALMLNCCRSSLVYRKGKYGIFVEKEESVVQHYDSNSIKDLKMWWSDLKDVPDTVHVQYVDPENEWVKVIAPANVSKPIRKQPRVSIMQLYGVTNFSQASRLAWFYLNQAVTANMFIKFQTNRRALDRTVGDVISLTDYITQFQKKKFRILKLEETQDEYIELTCREYNEFLYSEIQGSTSPVINVTDLPNSVEKIPPVFFKYDTQDYYILPDKTVVSRIFLHCFIDPYVFTRGIRAWYRKQGDEVWQSAGLYEDGTNIVLIDGMEVFQYYEFKLVHENAFGKRSTFTFTDFIYITGTNKVPDMPIDFQGSETVGGFKLGWKVAKERDIDYYELYTNSVAPENLVAKVYGTSYFYPTGLGNYVFLLLAVDTIGNKSTPALVRIGIESPFNVTGFDCVQNERNVEFRWNRVNNADYYVIKEGASWDYGNLIANEAGQTFILPYATHRQIEFWIKAYTKYGVSSELASYCTVIVAPIPNRNFIKQRDMVEEFWLNGKRFNTHINARGLQLEDGKTSGEFLYTMELGQEYHARNWVDKIIQPYANAKSILWKDATFKWNSESAKSNTWFPLGGDFTFRSWTELARYVGREKEQSIANLKDSWSLDNTLKSFNGKTPTLPHGAVKYKNSRYDAGLVIDGKSKIRWKDFEVPQIFTVSFIAKIPIDSDYNYALLTLRSNTGQALTLKYESIGDTFVLERNTGERVKAGDYSEPNDYMTFVISQSDTTLMLIVYSLAFNKYKFNKIKISNPVKYNRISLYGDLGMEGY